MHMTTIKGQTRVVSIYAFVMQRNDCQRQATMPTTFLSRTSRKRMRGCERITALLSVSHHDQLVLHLMIHSFQPRRNQRGAVVVVVVVVGFPQRPLIFAQSDVHI